MLGKREPGLVAFSCEYLQEAVAQHFAENNQTANGGEWLPLQLANEIHAVLLRHKARSGFAVLAGVARPVWVMPQSEFRLARAKRLSTETVEVLDHL
jgi:hypothetical protein